MHPSEGEKHIFGKDALESALEHRKYEKYGLQFACLMQSFISGEEIYKKMSRRMESFLTDRIPEAKNAQVMCETQNSSGPKKRKNRDQNSQKRTEGPIK